VQDRARLSQFVRVSAVAMRPVNAMGPPGPAGASELADRKNIVVAVGQSSDR
jgi:hypothetical protein